MGASQAGAIPLLTPSDIAGASALVGEAGWNQVAADWRLFLGHGRKFAIADEGRVVATAATLPSKGFDWISMVLLAKSHRRQGIATRLLEHCIAQLLGVGLVPALDATPAGRAVYQPPGFRDGWAIGGGRRACAGEGSRRAHTRGGGLHDR